MKANLSFTLALIERNQPKFVAGLAILAVLLGAYARFKGLSLWPLAVDEYYIVRSIERVLAVGIPEYACGGHYMRGITYQYLVAALSLLGSGESLTLTARVVAAASWIITIPAVFLLANRVGGRLTAILAVTALSLSTWEVEMARFARMYAPYQAIFVWYLYAFLRFTVDGRRSGLIGMLVLSSLGALTWEGGALLTVSNLLPLFCARQSGSHWNKRDSWYFGLCLALIGLAILFNGTDFRLGGATDLYPDGYVRPPGSGLVALPSFTLLSSLVSNSAGILFAATVVVILAVSLANLWRDRQSTIRERIAWSLAAMLTAAQQLGAAVAFLAVTALIRWWRPETIRRQSVRIVLVLTSVLALGWIVYGLGMDDPGGSLRRIAASLLKYPNLYDQVLSPWLEAMPVQTVIVFSCLLVIAVRVIVSDRNHDDVSDPARSLLAMTTLLLVLIGVVQPRYTETRYAFFLYPALIIFAVLVVERLSRAVSQRWTTAGSISLLCLLGVVSDDYSLRHLLLVDSPEVNFRQNVPLGKAVHHYLRSDFRTPAEYVNAHRGPHDLVISTVLVTDYYLDRLDFLYFDQSDARYPIIACHRGTADRWSGRPLLSNLGQVRGALANRETDAWLVVSVGARNTRLWERQLAQDLGLAPAPVAAGVDGAVAVYHLPGGSR